MNQSMIRSRHGFTLVEMLVVMAIILIIAGFGATGLLRVLRKQSEEATKGQVALISQALEAYRGENGGYPVGEGSNLLYRSLYWDAAQGGGTVFLEKFSGGKWIEGDGETATVVDPWGNEYGYRCVGDQNPDFDLWSAGPDGEAVPDDPDAAVNRDNIENW